MALVAAWSLLLGSGRAGEGGPADTSAEGAFARFVALEGTWHGTNGHGEPVTARAAGG